MPNAVAVAKAKVKDITRLYDTDRFGRQVPTADNVRAKIKEIGARTGVNDYFVLCSPGHGDPEENPEAPSGVDGSVAGRGHDDRRRDRLAHHDVLPVGRARADAVQLATAAGSDVDTGGVWGACG